MLRISSSQHAIPPLRSLAQVHQPLRGVMITSGDHAGFLPWIPATTLNASACVRFTWTTTVTSEPRRARSVRKVASSLDTCKTGGPKGCKKLSAFLGQRPGRPPRVTIISARWRFWRRASPVGPVSVLLGAVSVSPIEASLPSKPSRPLTPAEFVTPPSKSGMPSIRRPSTVRKAATGSMREILKTSRPGDKPDCRTSVASQLPEA